MGSLLKTWMERQGFTPMPDLPAFFWSLGDPCFRAIGVRSGGARDGTSMVDLRTGVVDEYRTGPERYVTASYFVLNRNEVVYHGWSRNWTWGKDEEPAMLATLEKVGLPHLGAFSEPSALKQFLIEGLHAGHPPDPEAVQQPSLLGRLLKRELGVGRPATRGVPVFGYAVGILCDKLGQREEAITYLSEYRRTLTLPAFQDTADAVDRRLEALRAPSVGVLRL